MTGSTTEERGGPIARRAGFWVGLGLFALLLFAPQLIGLDLDGAQRRVAAVTALTATWWITVTLPVGATSLLPAMLFPLLGVMTAKQCAPVYMNDLVMLFIGAFIIALGLERWGVHRRVALFIISKIGTSRRRIILGFMCASAFLSMWINNTATTLLMLPIALAVIARVESEGQGPDKKPYSETERQSFAIALLLSIAYSASVGGMGTPVGTAPNVEFLAQFGARFPEGPKISFGDWFIAWLPLVVLFVPLAWLLMTRVVYPMPAGSPEDDARAAAVVHEERISQGRMNRSQVRMSAIFIATALLWVTRSDLNLGFAKMPGWSRLLMGSAASDPAWYNAHKNDVSDSTVATCMALLCFVLPSGTKKGEFLMDWRTAVRLPWDVLLLLGGGICLARGFQVSRLDEVLGERIAPLFELGGGWAASWLVVAGVILFMSLLTEVTSNTATTAVLLPVIAKAAVAAKISPLLVMVPATIAASAAFMLPVATPPNAVIFSSGRVSVPAMARAGPWFNILMVVLITLVFQLWVRRVWGIDGDLPSWVPVDGG
ncbi:MAG: sodium-dependent dicarboxylate transporter 2/3/5 [Planctomycetota bacterium]|jgi:sodium-dependent dicarboxylate transporter 2/3/5